jgi:hypothetical protein
MKVDKIDINNLLEVKKIIDEMVPNDSPIKEFKTKKELVELVNDGCGSWKSWSEYFAAKEQYEYSAKIKKFIAAILIKAELSWEMNFPNSADGRVHFRNLLGAWREVYAIENEASPEAPAEG